MTVMEISQHRITARYGDRRRLGRFERGDKKQELYRWRMGK
jgi:hypothetical protein